LVISGSTKSAVVFNVETIGSWNGKKEEAFNKPLKSLEVSIVLSSLRSGQS